MITDKYKNLMANSNSYIENFTYFSAYCLFSKYQAKYDNPENIVVLLSDKLDVCAYYTIWSSQEETRKGSFPLFFRYLGSYYTIGMIGSRYKSLEVLYTKP